MFDIVADKRKIWNLQRLLLHVLRKDKKKKNFLYYDEKKMTPKNSISHLSMQSLNALECSLISNFL